MSITLINGECLEVMDRLISQGIVVDAIITDLPYGTTANPRDIMIPFAPMWGRIDKITKPNGPIVLHGAEPFSSKLRLSNEKNYKYDWYWKKTTATNYQNANRQPLRVIENVCVFYKKQPTYNPQKTQGHKRKVTTAKQKSKCKQGEVYRYTNPVGYDSTERYPTNVLEFKSDKQKHHYHCNQKPLEMIIELVLTHTNKGDIVLDFTAGSMTTGIACLVTGRNFIGIEKYEDTFQIGKSRIQGCMNERSELDRYNTDIHDLGRNWSNTIYEPTQKRTL